MEDDDDDDDRKKRTEFDVTIWKFAVEQLLAEQRKQVRFISESRKHNETSTECIRLIVK